MGILHPPLPTYWPTSRNKILLDCIHAQRFEGRKKKMNELLCCLYILNYKFMGWLITETNSEVGTPLLTLSQGKKRKKKRSMFGAPGIMHCSQSSEQRHTSPAVSLHCAEKTGLCGMLRKVCCRGDAPFHYYQTAAGGAKRVRWDTRRRTSMQRDILSWGRGGSCKTKRKNIVHT